MGILLMRSPSELSGSHELKFTSVTVRLNMVNDDEILMKCYRKSSLIWTNAGENEYQLTTTLNRHYFSSRTYKALLHKLKYGKNWR